MDMIGRIWRLHGRKHKSEREISRMTGLSRNTISKWLRGEVDGPPKYRRGEQPNKLTVFHEALKQALKADARRPTHERRTAKALYAEIKLSGYEGVYSRVTDFVREWRHGQGQGAAVNAFVPLAFELGEAYQFDWSEEGLVVGGIYYRVQVSHMKLCASRAFWLVAYPSPRPRDAVRCPHALVCGAGWCGPARHPRQHEDGGGQGQEGQGPHRQRALRDHVRALLGRPGLLQRRFGLGEGGGREERAGQPPARTRRSLFAARGSTQPRSSSAASPNSTPGLPIGAGPCGRRSVTLSTSSSAWLRCWSTSART